MAEYITTDTDLTSIANAIRTKGGTSAQLAFPAEFISAIEAISGGGGGGGRIATGSVVLAEDYKYTSDSAEYTGSFLVDTGLTKIHSVFIIDTKWYDKTLSRPGFGAASWVSPKSVGLEPGGTTYVFNGYGSGVAATASNWAPSWVKTICVITHEYASNISEGCFGMKVSSASYSIKAGDTLLWYATGV